MLDYAERRRKLAERMREAGVDLLFLAPSSDLEYLTGVERTIPTFGQSEYAHGWVAGAFFRPEREPVFVLPRMMTLFDVAGELPGELVVVSERDDGPALFEQAARGLGSTRTLAVGDRIWAETVIQLTEALSPERLVTGSSLVNELRRTKSPAELAVMERACGVCDATMAAVAPKVAAGRDDARPRRGGGAPDARPRLAGPLVHDPRLHGLRRGQELRRRDPHRCRSRRATSSCSTSARSWTATARTSAGRSASGSRRRRYATAHALVLAAQEAGRAALRPGVPASEVNRACREPIEAAGYGASFKHRMGHGIGLDVHERPFVSEEDDTPLEAGMTFTDEPSILVDGRFGVRTEDVVVCEPDGGRKLNRFPPDLIVNA